MNKTKEQYQTLSDGELTAADKQQLIKLNLSSDGMFEPEGVHIHKGQMYLGFMGDYPTAGSRKHTCIIKLK